MKGRIQLTERRMPENQMRKDKVGFAPAGAVGAEARPGEGDWPQP